MNMNKLKMFLIGLTSTAILTMLTACGNEAAKEPADTSAEITAGEEIPEETADIEGDLIADEEEIDLDDYFPDNASEGGDAADNAEESDNPLMPVIDKVLAESEWPVMAEVTDGEILKEYFLLDNSDGRYEQMIVMQCPMSAQMSEIIIIKAEDTKSAWEDINARRQKAIDTDAWYPADKELAEASIVETQGEYVYFIIGVNAEAARSTIAAYVHDNP